MKSHLVQYQYKSQAPVSRIKPFSIMMEPEVCSLLKQVPKEKIRKVLVELIISENLDVPQNIVEYYHQL